MVEVRHDVVAVHKIARATGADLISRAGSSLTHSFADGCCPRVSPIVDRMYEVDLSRTRLVIPASTRIDRSRPGV